jgi:hypothetical protein
MIKPELDSIREMSTEKSFQRGQRYFEEGRVKIKEATHSSIISTVSGTGNYRVEINLDNLSAVCSCPYELEGFCKHIVATFLAIDQECDEIDRMTEENCSQLKKMEMLLDKMEPEELRAFLSQELKTHSDMGSRFMARFSKNGEGISLSKYKAEIDLLFDEAEEYGFLPYGAEVDFSPFEDLAEIHMHKDDFKEAAKIYQSLTETISEKMDHVDDSDGFYGDRFSYFLQSFAECIKMAELDVGERRKYIEYIFNKYLQNDPDYFQDDYYDALKELCTSKEDLEYWKKLLQPHLPERIPDKQDWSKYFDYKELISMQLHLHSKLGEMSDYYALMEMHYLSCPDFCLQYAKQLFEDGDRSKAIQAIEDGIAFFPDYMSKSLREFLSEIYRKSDPEKYNEQLLALFLQSGEWKFYECLKMSVSKEEWRKMLDIIIAHLAQDRYARTTLVDIYLREQMHDNALQAVIAQKSIYSLRAYRNELARLYPKEYFGAYNELIIPFANSRMGREHYRDVVSYLKEMKAIEGFDYEVQEIVGRLRSENRRRPAFIDELKVL